MLKMAPDSPCAGHLGERKTLQWGKSSFYWPQESHNVKEHCRSCDKCQVVSPARKTVKMDCISPLSLPSARSHRYALCVVDLHTRWSQVACLRPLMAKSTCAALLQIFSHDGVLEIIWSDQGTNITPKLMEVEWHVKKDAFSHSRHGSGQDRKSPFLLWAYHKVPHATTWRSLFELMNGRLLNEYPSILKKTWSGDWVVPESLSIPAAEYR